MIGSISYPCKACGVDRGPGQPDGYPDDHLCLRCWRAENGLSGWLQNKIAYLESIERTEHGDGALYAYKATLKELERD